MQEMVVQNLLPWMLGIQVAAKKLVGFSQRHKDVLKMILKRKIAPTLGMFFLSRRIVTDA